MRRCFNKIAQLMGQIVCLAIVLAGISVSAADTEKATPQRAVLVTGASSGIGNQIAKTLASEGYFVYAGARKQKGIEALSALDNMLGIRLDVTVQSDIDAAVKLVESEARGLYGLVNNAGVAVFGPIMETSEADMQFQMDVNVLGPYRVTKAFAPLLIESKGRITTIGSIAGLVGAGMLGPYNMSKFAMEGFTDALASEMRKFGVQVSIVEPGNFNSNVIRAMEARMARNGILIKDSRFQEEWARMKQYFPADRSGFKKPIAVAEAVLDAVSATKPKRRYLVAPVAAEADLTIRAMLAKVVQLNDDNGYSKTRDELIALLDEQLPEQDKQ